MKHFSADDVHSLLDYPGLVEALRELFRDGVDVLDRQVYQEGGRNSWILLPAWQYGKIFGIKLVSVFPDNQKLGLASVQGIYALFDGATGVPIATVDGAALTLRKTAANSALAATYLAREDASTLLMVGAGALAPYMIEAHCAVRSIKKVSIWNRTPATAQKVAQELNQKLGAQVTAISDLEAAARQAHVISCATMSGASLIKGSWLSEGTHLDLVGGYQPDMREADDEAVRRAGRVYVDAPSTVEVCGDICQPLEAGLITSEEIIDTFQLARGQRPGRQSPQEITLFKSGGGGHEDLGTAKYLLKASEIKASTRAIR